MHRSTCCHWSGVPGPNGSKCSSSAAGAGATSCVPRNHVIDPSGDHRLCICSLQRDLRCWSGCGQGHLEEAQNWAKRAHISAAAVPQVVQGYRSQGHLVPNS